MTPATAGAWPRRLCALPRDSPRGRADSVGRAVSAIAILPMKSFHEAKRRLADGMTPGERRVLAQAMFSDVLVALRRARAVEAVLVVTADPDAQQIAGGYGATVLGDDDQGHNRAAGRGVAHALEIG